MLRAKASSREFLRLLEPIRDSLYRHAARTVWFAHQVDDVVQEAILTAWREFNRFEPGTNFRAWMFRILLNTTFRVNKKEWRHYETHEDAAANFESRIDAQIEQENAWALLLEDPEKLSELLDDRLVEALNELHLVERECLLLRLLEGFSYRQISSMLGVPVGTAMSHVHRARWKLREQLAELAVEHGLKPSQECRMPNDE